jgi:hypothetical protein
MQRDSFFGNARAQQKINKNCVSSMEEQVLQAIDQYNQEIKRCEVDRSSLFFDFVIDLCRHFWLIFAMLLFGYIITLQPFIILLLICHSSLRLIILPINAEDIEDIESRARFDYMNDHVEQLDKDFFLNNKEAIMDLTCTESDSRRVICVLSIVSKKFIPKATKSDAFEQYVERTGVSLDKTPIESIDQYLTLRKKEKEQQASANQTLNHL